MELKKRRTIRCWRRAGRNAKRRAKSLESIGGGNNRRKARRLNARGFGSFAKRAIVFSLSCGSRFYRLALPGPGPGGLRRAVDARCQSNQVAHGPYHLVFRDVRPEEVDHRLSARESAVRL